MKLLMGIDLGSTNIKVVVFDGEGNEVANATTPNTVESMDPKNKEWLFWNPPKLWQSVKESIAKCVNVVNGGGTVEAVSVTGMGMDGLPVDKDGKELYPFISWKCKRTEKVCDTWSRRIGVEKIFYTTGKQVMAIDTLYRILWLKEQKPEIYEKTDKWILIEDFINYKLCGNIATDYSMASSTSLFDQTKQKWSDEILRITGIDKRMLPQVKQSGEVLGTILPDVAAETGLGRNTKIILGGHDYSCAAVAAGALQNDKIFNITGTWEMFFSATDTFKANKKLYKSGFKCERHAVKNKYAIFADVVSSLMVEWFKENFIGGSVAGGMDVWDYMSNLSKNAGVSSNGMFFLPHILGKGCPETNGKSLGAFIGISALNDLGSMIRSIIEGLNYQFKEIVDAYENMTKKKIDNIISVGGATKNAFWMQNKADICGKMIEVPALTEATALGAALFAGIGTGLYKNEEEAHLSIKKPGIIYTPGKDSLSYRNHYHQYYKKIYPALKNLNRDIFDGIKCK